MNTQVLRNAILAAITTAIGGVASAASDQPSGSNPASETEQVVLPQVDRRDIKLPRFPSNDFEIGTFIGSYATQNFGTSMVGGLRLGYHVTEDFFVEGVLAQTSVSDEAFRQVLPSGVFPSDSEKLSYYNLSVGYNILPGEVFIGSKRAKPMSFYVIGGIGSTSFNQQNQSTFNLGSGLRVYLNDHFALQVDVRDHIFSLDLLGKRSTTQNIELTAGITASF
jgi:outer membrane beta-barrel protein